MTKRILVLGSTGMLGSYVFKHLSSCGLSVNKLNRDEYNAECGDFKKLVSQTKIQELKKGDVIVNCIGLLPHVFKSNSISADQFDDETNQKFILINSILPHNLSKIQILKNIKVINITSDCVYSGDKGDYSEEDVPDYYWIYGITKTAGECDEICNIRSSIIGEEQFNKRSLLEWVLSNKNKEINGYTNYIWNGVTCLQMAKIIEDVIKKNLFWEGTRHILSPSKVSKHKLTSLINEIYGLNIKINNFYLDKKIDRSLSSQYKNDFPIPELEVQIKELYHWHHG